MNQISIIKFSHKQHDHLIDQLTELLHQAYAPLAKAGMKYMASHQKPEKTRERLSEGESYLIFLDKELIGTVTLYKEKMNSSCEYYRKKGVYSFGQFAIKPEFQGNGFGSSIMNFLETRAKELGATELALDTSEHANHLIQMYSKRSYKIVSTTQWDVTNYLSVIMSKSL